MTVSLIFRQIFDYKYEHVTYSKPSVFNFCFVVKSLSAKRCRVQSYFGYRTEII